MKQNSRPLLRVSALKL